jgi:WXXGXW repeat (2 copies)
MKFNKPLLALLVAASLAGMMQSTVATAEVRIFLNDAPPALRYEPVPSPRRGYTWAPGYWDSNRGQHAWRRGS